MELAQLRDRLVEQRTNYVNAVKNSEKACSEIEEILHSISQEDLDVLDSCGIDISAVINVDLDAIRGDEHALDKYKIILNQKILELHDFLEENLNV